MADRSTLGEVLRLDVESRDELVRRVMAQFPERGYSFLDIENAILQAFGTFVTVVTYGRELGTFQLTWPEMGVPASAERAREYRPPDFRPLPAEPMAAILAAMERARSATRYHGIYLDYHAQHWVPLSQWQAWKDAIATIQAELARIKQEQLLGPYEEVLADAILRGEALARESYADLQKIGVVSTRSRKVFVELIRRRVKESFPTRSEIEVGIGFGWRTVQSAPPDLIQMVVACRDQLQHDAMRRLSADRRSAILAARQRERLVRETMMQERLEVWRLQSERSSLLNDLSRNAGGNLYALAVGLGRGDESLSSGASRRLRAALTHWLEIGGLLASSRQVDALARAALARLDVPARQRDLPGLKGDLASLAAELELLADRKPAMAPMGRGLAALETPRGRQESIAPRQKPPARQGDAHDR